MEVWLPRCIDHTQGVAGAAVSEPELAAPAGQTILLVDDAVGLRDLTQMHLSDAGYSVTCAASGTEALELIRAGAERFDIIVTDYAMPSMSGLDLITAARAQRPQWPAVIISGYADLEDVSRRPSDVPLLAKPFTRTALLQAVRNVAALAR
jgi:CheY-like chemotaxis protein